MLKGYYTDSYFMGFVDGVYLRFATESDYEEYVEETQHILFCQEVIMSRPKKEVIRSEVVKFKTTKAEKEVLKKKANLLGISVSELIRRKLND